MPDRSTHIPHTAMVFAAGLGKRMRPLTESVPKPLVSVAGKPLIEYTLEKLEEAGVKRAVINTHYLHEQVETYLANRNGIEIVISYEETLLETGGGLMKALPHLGSDPFFVVNTDIIWGNGKEFALHRLAHHWQPTMNALLLLQKKEQAHGYKGAGDFFLENNGTLRKITDGTTEHPYIFTGIQILHPRLLDKAPAASQKAFSLNVLYANSIQENGRLQNIFAIEHDSYWLHTGDIDALREAEAFLKHTQKATG